MICLVGELELDYVKIFFSFSGRPLEFLTSGPHPIKEQHVLKLTESAPVHELNGLFSSTPSFSSSSNSSNGVCSLSEECP